MSLIATLKTDIITQLGETVMRDEWRVSRYGVLNSAVEMTKSVNSIVNDDIRKKAMESEGLDLKIPVIKKGDLTVKNVRSCQIGSYENESALVDVTWTTLVYDISMIPGQYKNNYISYLEDLRKKLKLVEEGFGREIETIIIAKLEAEKSGIYNSPLATAPYSVVGDTLQVPLALRPTFFNDLSVIMQGDDLYAVPYKVLGNTTLQSPVNHYINQGGGNAVNTNYQFGDYDFRFSNSLPVSAGKFTSGFVMPDGSIGLLTRVNEDARQEHKTTKGTEWSEEMIEGLGLNVGVMYLSDCADMSAVAGMSHLTATKVEKWQFSIDVAVITPYNSDPATIAGSIKKFDFAIA